MGLAVLNAPSGAAYDGSTITLFTVEAFAPAATRSVRFTMSGPLNSSKLERSARWTLFGNTGNQLGGRRAVPGTYSVTATAFSGIAGTGDVVATGSITFSFAEVD
jgi:hypothetical protein